MRMAKKIPVPSGFKHPSTTDFGLQCKITEQKCELAYGSRVKLSPKKRGECSGDKSMLFTSKSSELGFVETF